jgi:hypothetical protein
MYNPPLDPIKPGQPVSRSNLNDAVERINKGVGVVATGANVSNEFGEQIVNVPREDIIHIKITETGVGGWHSAVHVILDTDGETWVETSLRTFTKDGTPAIERNGGSAPVGSVVEAILADTPPGSCQFDFAGGPALGLVVTRLGGAFENENPGGPSAFVNTTYPNGGPPSTYSGEMTDRYLVVPVTGYDIPLSVDIWQAVTARELSQRQDVPLDYPQLVRLFPASGLESNLGSGDVVFTFDRPAREIFPAYVTSVRPGNSPGNQNGFIGPARILSFQEVRAPARSSLGATAGMNLTPGNVGFYEPLLELDPWGRRARVPSVAAVRGGNSTGHEFWALYVSFATSGTYQLRLTGVPGSTAPISVGASAAALRSAMEAAGFGPFASVTAMTVLGGTPTVPGWTGGPVATITKYEIEWADGTQRNLQVLLPNLPQPVSEGVAVDYQRSRTLAVDDVVDLVCMWATEAPIIGIRRLTAGDISTHTHEQQDLFVQGKGTLTLNIYRAGPGVAQVTLTMPVTASSIKAAIEGATASDGGSFTVNVLPQSSPLGAAFTIEFTDGYDSRPLMAVYGHTLLPTDAIYRVV